MMPVTHGAKPPGIPALEMRVGQLAKVVAFPSGYTPQVEEAGIVIQRGNSTLQEVGGKRWWKMVGASAEDLPLVEILPNGSTLTVADNE